MSVRKLAGGPNLLTLAMIVGACRQSALAIPTCVHSIPPQWRVPRPQCGSIITKNATFCCLLIFMTMRGPNTVSLPGTASGSRLRRRAQQRLFSCRPRGPGLKRHCRFLRAILACSPAQRRCRSTSKRRLGPNSTGGKRRREDITPKTYGAMIALVSTLLYGHDSEKLREAGILRAEAMAFRDARGEAITDTEWSTIESILTKSYKILKREVSNGTSGRSS
jgi:hypothetical protein